MQKKSRWLIGVCVALGFGLSSVDYAAAQHATQEELDAMSADERSIYNKAVKGGDVANWRQKWDAGTVNQRQRRSFTPKAVSKAASKAFGDSGVISYDSGSLGTCCINGQTVGNRFDTNMGAPLAATQTITAVQFHMIAVAPANVFLTFYGPLMGTSANRLGGSILTPATTGLNTKTFTSPITNMGPSFLAGVWQFTPDSPAVATGTTAGQGFHGMSINDGVVGTMFTSLSGLNAVFRVGGNGLGAEVPVELMNLKLEQFEVK